MYKFDKNDTARKHYVLEMFSYPSGAKLHVGHWYNYALSDSYARFKKMQGFNVFEPMGFDSFGLPAENYAIKTGIHPQDSTLKNIEIMEEQLKNMGAMFDWDAEVKTCMPDYYKWTQWMFLKLYEKGLAYRKEAPVNWCPSCNTVLANEQVSDGECERCHSTGVKKKLTQWFFKITDYAQELLDGLNALDWPEKTKLMQKNWIGRSEGGEIEFVVDNADRDAFRVFTTRADTLFGVTYVVLAPEHPLVDKITAPDRRQAVEEYRLETSKVNEIERLSTAKEKTGVFTGAYAFNPINGDRVPILIGDYVLYSYGTGCVMGVPAHDERDFVFAQKHGLPIKRVVCGAEGKDELPFTEYGVMTNSGEFDGMTSEEGRRAVVEKLARKNKGELKVNYRLRDWLVSRQRYWGAPIPVVYCEKCGTVPVPEKELPVLLPYDVDFRPDGESPLKKHKGFMNPTCPRCGGKAVREADTLDTFVCSSWYFLRYADSKNDKAPFDKETVNKILPVDKYIGGAEHACMHLLYARFFTKALRDMGYLNFDEPFLSLVHQGTILGPDGTKMSKSKDNVISPDDWVNLYGSDALRVYLGFGFNYVEGGPWNDDGTKGIVKWLERVERVVLNACKNRDAGGSGSGSDDGELLYVLNSTIKAVTDDYDKFSFNTAVARMMELVNAMNRLSDKGGASGTVMADCANALVRLLAPLAPHIAEELWENIGEKFSVFNAPFPVCDQSKLQKQSVELAVQINSKIRGKINVSADADKAEIEAAALNNPEIAALLDGKSVKKAIIVPNRLVNLIV